MTDTYGAATGSETYDDNMKGAGVVIFAAFMLLIAGGWQMLVGFIALVNDNFYRPSGDYLVKFNPSTWGWIHILVGLVLLLAGAGLFGGSMWARVVGVLGAGASALSMFAFMPYYPVWAISVLVADVVIVWALCAYGGVLRGST